MSDLGTTLVVLAAGMGSRYGGLKQVDPVGPHGEIVVDYSVYDAIKAGFSHIVFVIRPELEPDFRARINRTMGSHVQCDLVFQEQLDVPPGKNVTDGRKKPWGTAHAIYAARHVVSQPFGVINADDFYGRHSFQLLADHLRNPQTDEYSLIAFVLSHTLSNHGSVSRGVCQVNGGYLSDIVERTAIHPTSRGATFEHNGSQFDMTGSEPVSMNMWGFTPSYFTHLEQAFTHFLDGYGTDPTAEFQIPTMIKELLRAGTAKVCVSLSSERWLGVTYPEDKQFVQQGIHRLVEEGGYPAPLWRDGTSTL